VEDERALERATVNAAVWGTQAADLVPELRAAELVDPWCSAVVSAIADVSTMADTSQPGALALATHERLVATGIHEDRDFYRLCLADVPPGTLDALPFLLGQLDEAAQRRRVLARLVALADTLERPGGPARVAELIGMTS
jgi:hypothetical protein